MEEKIYQLSLSLLPKVGPITARTLVSYCGSPEAVFRASKKALLKIPRIGPVVANEIKTGKVILRAERELALIQENGIKMLFYLDDQYPRRLKAFEDSPICLFFKGEGDLNPKRSVGIVGTRDPSGYGILQCEKLVEGFLKWDATIVSGLAYGIDSVAHRASCKIGLPTLAVMANGLGSVYPSSHRSLATRILESGGLLSEHTYETAPEKDFFPMRNRIIASMADAIIVVESKKTGGSLITAEFANRYGREVFALPGRASDQRSAGCHLLIKHHKANLLDEGEDLANVLGWTDAESTPSFRQGRLFEDLDGHAKIIVDLLGRSASKSVDEIAISINCTLSEAISQLLELECLGWIKTLPGSRYTLAR